MTNELSRSGRGLCEELIAYQEWLRSKYRDAGITWGRVSVFERRDDIDLMSDEIDDLVGFENRFAEILVSTTRDWVNLAAVKIRGDTLIVAIVWLADEHGNRKPGQGPVSINWAGFEAREVERLVGTP